MIEQPPKSAPASDAGDAVVGRAGPRVGERIGPYLVVRLLGEGTGGRVFEVMHEKLGRPAALKLLDPAHVARPSARARFFAEALSITRINHPHIVEVTDIVETDEHAGTVMELLEGVSLGAAMRAGGLPPERFLPVLAQVCEALAAAHAAGFVHRDLKPENVFLCERHGVSDFVKLLDFGVAAPLPARTSVSSSESSRRRVARGAFVGTPAYASPEQASGAPVDHTTDLYAVGVMLYELVCGRLPFEGWSAGELLIQHLSAPVPHLPDEARATPLGAALDAVVQGCMNKDPALRFSSAAELAETFTALARGEIVPIVTGATPLRRARRVRPLVLVAMMLMGGAALAGYLVERGAPRSSERPAAVPLPSAPEAAPAAVVTLAFESEPEGAEVRQAAGGALLGVTPFRRAFPRGDELVSVEFACKGFEPVRLEISTAAPRTVSARLAPVAKPKRRAWSWRPAPHGNAHLGSEKTLNPFRR